ncbi:MAG: hypothetical protein ACRDS1_01970 [Pseudonocardiaceae bacterium]
MTPVPRPQPYRSQRAAAETPPLAHYRTGAFVVEPRDVAGYKTAVDKIGRLAMSPADFLALITQTAHELEAAT